MVFRAPAPYTAVMLAAAEPGGSEVYDHTLAALEADCPSTDDYGVLHRRHASVWSHRVELMARAGAQNAFRNLLATPSTHAGPRLEGLAYPEILVASAHVENGELRAILYDQKEDIVSEIEVFGLQPHTNYALYGAASGHVVADENGRARFTISLKGRTVLCLHPE